MEPMKAVLSDERFSDPAWIYERKLDGIRCIATKGDKRVDLQDDLDGGQVEKLSSQIDERLRDAVPDVTEVFLDATPPG